MHIKLECQLQCVQHCLRKLYFKSNGNIVYGCVLDASKAFDRIKYDTLFEILLEIHFPVRYISLLIDSYINQNIRVQWGNYVSELFNGVNGVLQGGVISPIFFTAYTDKLISKLKTCGAGCWVGHHYYGCLIYADDVKLLNPSITGLQKHVDTCLEFGVEYSLTFNDRKTVCLKYSHSGDLTVPVVCLNGQTLKWEANVKHVGNIIICTLDDIELKKREYVCQVNKLLSDFQRLRHDVLSELFNKY